jgi:cyclophilin family peptidyl-prolyl cis-trans isomerase
MAATEREVVIVITAAVATLFTATVAKGSYMLARTGNKTANSQFFLPTGRVSETIDARRC